MGETAVRRAERHGDNGIRNATCTISLWRTINIFNPAKISCNQKEGKKIRVQLSPYCQNLKVELQQP